MWNFFRRPTPAPPQRTEPRLSKRSYAAAQSSARYADFDAARTSADVELSNGMTVVRAKARSLARNSSVMKRYISLMRTNVVGPGGFHFQCRAKKLDGSFDKSVNDRIEAAWFDFCGNPTTRQRGKMRDFDKLAVASWARDGEFFVEFVYDPTFSNFKHGFALHALEADMLDEMLNTMNTVNGNRIKLGVEMDDLDRPVAYWMLTSHPGDTTWTVNNAKNRHRRVPASQIIHVYDELRVGQSRGEAPASAIVNSVKMLDGYREAEVTGRRVMASQGGFIETDPGSPSNIDALADGHEVADDDESDLVMNLEPGTYRSLKPGQHFKVANPGGSITDFQQFDQQMKMDISMGLNISAMSLAMEAAGISYSSGRTVTIEDRDYYRDMQQFFIDNLKEPIFREWLRLHMISDAAQVPPSKMGVILTGATFRGRGWDWVDPAKDIKANAQALETFQTSLTQIAAQRGMDVGDLIDEIKSDRELLKAANLTPPPDVVKPASPATPGAKNG